MELHQCPYNKSCKCAMTDPCFGCEDFKPSAEANVSKDDSNCNLPHVSGSVLNINLHEYGYSCGDGCCYNYGTITTLNKTELPCHNQDAGTILRQVLEHLGYCVEITYSDDIS